MTTLTQDERRSVGCRCVRLDDVWHHERSCLVPAIDAILATRAAVPGAAAAVLALCDQRDADCAPQVDAHKAAHPGNGAVAMLSTSEVRAALAGAGLATTTEWGILDTWYDEPEVQSYGTDTENASAEDYARGDADRFGEHVHLMRRTVAVDWHRADEPDACPHGCGTVEPYGFVVAAGCPVHEDPFPLHDDARHDPAYVTIPRPVIRTGPTHLSDNDATIRYLHDAATRVSTGRFWGAGVSALVADVLDQVAAAMELPTEPASTLEVTAKDPTPVPGWRTAVARCPRCGHQPHGRVCFNLASDGDCDCKGPL